MELPVAINRLSFNGSACDCLNTINKLKYLKIVMRYIYARVSSESQNVQQQAEYLTQKYDHDAVVTESFTGTTTERPKFRELISKLGRDDVLIVYHVSRLGRNSSEVLETVESLKNKGVRVYVDQLQGIDITSGVGKSIFHNPFWTCRT